MNKTQRMKEQVPDVIVEKTTWDQRITQAELKSEFTPQDMSNAHDWCTCAVSEHIDFTADKFYNWNTPMSLDASVLGRQFHIAVVRNDFAEARKIYHKIGKLNRVFDGRVD